MSGIVASDRLWQANDDAVAQAVPEIVQSVLLFADAGSNAVAATAADRDGQPVDTGLEYVPVGLPEDRLRCRRRVVRGYQNG